MRARQSGFTLIELVIVIVVLGILAATALPRFIDLGSDARAAKLSGAVASIKSAAALAHAAALATGAAPGAAITMEGASIAMANRYPTAHQDGIIAAAQIQTADGFSFPTTNTGVAGESLTISVDGAATPANCGITYTNPGTLGDAPTYAVSDTGC